MHELLEAIDLKKNDEIAEEIGDVLFALIFIGKIGENEGLFTFSQALRLINEKLIRRHPHIFSNEKVDSVDEIVKNWERIKKQEKERKTILDGIPSTLPALTLAQKIIEKLRRVKSELAPHVQNEAVVEEEIGRQLWEIVGEAQRANIDAEGALRRYSQSKGNIYKKNTGD